MWIDPQILIFLGSLVAIGALAGLARLMGLGSKPSLQSETELRQAADEVESGFDPAQWSISRKGDAALVADNTGRIMVIKRHGNQFAGRILTSAASAREEIDALIVDCGESWFGPVRLNLANAPAWADRINRL